MAFKISKKDWIFIGIVAAVFATFIAISGREKTKKVPYNDIHRPYYEIYEATGSKEKAVGDCENCHNERVMPLPANHVKRPKNGIFNCLLCHKLIKVEK